jgi:hypothetical protein
MELEKEKFKLSTGLKVLSITAIIANGIWLLLFLMLFVGCIVNGQTLVDKMDISSVFTNLVFVFALASLIVVLDCLVCILAVGMIWRGEKKGLKLYVGANSLWVLLVFYASGGDFMYITAGLLSVIFMFGIAILSKDSLS